MELKGPFKEKIFFKKKGVKSLLKKKNHYFFVDSYFKKHPEFSSIHENIFFVEAGENLKTLDSFSTHVSWLQSKNADKSSTVVAVGGGSVGDSIGFLASVYLRGVDLIHIPTTWLSAVDSSVGGKTAVNFGSFKNQIGTVYAPKEIIFFKNLIESSSVEESKGEILKTLFLNLHKKWAKEIINAEKKDLISFSDIAKLIDYKANVVKKDPLDAKGVRAVLNLGHSLGHAFELQFKISHSEAVIKGLKFALEWSFKKRYLSKNSFDLLSKTIKESLPVMDSDLLKVFLQKDKKTIKNKINFIFLSDKGPVAEWVSISSVVREYERQLKGRND